MSRWFKVGIAHSLPSDTEKIVNDLSRLGIDLWRLQWSNLLPSGNNLSDRTVRRLCILRIGLVDWHIEPANCILRYDLQRVRDDDILTLPTSAAHTQPN